MDTVSILLGSPRGRFFCANIGYACSDERASYYHRPQTSSDVVDVLADIETEAIAALSEIGILDAFAYAVDFARYWQPPDEDDVMFADPEVVDVLHSIAQAIVASTHTGWWSDPIDRANQRSVEKFVSSYGWSELPLSIRRIDDGLERWRTDTLANEDRFREYLSADPNRKISGEWWSTPYADGVYVTTRARDVVGALELLLHEDDISDGAQARIWPMHVRGNPRVYEITSPADWAHLVDTYPLAVPASRRSDWHDTTGEYHNWLIPDWTRVVVDYDAVHLTMIGYLSTPGIAIHLTEHSGATVLAGWGPDATHWLRSDFITIDKSMTQWRRSSDDTWVLV